MPLDDDNDDDDDADEEMTAQEKDARIRALVPELPASEWGRKPEVAEISGSSSKAARPPKSKLGSPPKMRAPLLARDEFDGHIEESDDESDDDEPKAPAGSMGRIIGDMTWGGPDEETRAAKVEEITEEEEARQDAEAKRSVRWDDDDQVEDEEAELEPDMRQEEEEFLKFTREQLGITEDMWQRIMSERKARGGRLSSLKCTAIDGAQRLFPTLSQTRLPPSYRRSLNRILRCRSTSLSRSVHQT